MKLRLLTVLLGLGALVLAINSAYFSIVGISKLFAGAYTAVVVMAASLEAAKLITASFLYNYWKRLSILMKTYMTIGVMILVFISSVGIYGFLTAAYQTTSDQLSIIDQEVGMIESKRIRYQEQLNNYTDERNSITESITNLAQGLSGGTTVQYIDPETGQLITTTSSSARNVFEKQLINQQNQRDLITTRMDALTDSVAALDIQILEIQLESDIAAEIGPLRYLSDITGKSMNLIVSWLALLFTIVFDPLAVTMVIAFNMMITSDRDNKNRKGYKEYQVYGNDGLEKTTTPESTKSTPTNSTNNNSDINDKEVHSIPMDENEYVVDNTIDVDDTKIDSSKKKS
jgi:hypothetical protein